jgi:hypothetical protein
VNPRGVRHSAGRYKSVFSFFFTGNGSTLIGGPPWTILNDPGDAAVATDPPIDTETLTNAESFVRMDDEQAAHQSKRFRAIREATGLVWRQFMLRAFDHAVSTGAIRLYARRQAVSAGYEQFPNDVWPLLEVADWQNGVAIAPDGTTYWSFTFSRQAKSEAVSTRWTGMVS